MHIPAHQAIAVFDTGIGSYAIVEKLRSTYPTLDLIYLADRQSFPYGEKSREVLHACVRQALHYLITEHRVARIVIASNAPSVLLLDELRAEFTVPLYGVSPPLEEAQTRSRSRRIGILGVQSLIESPAFMHFIDRLRAPDVSVHGFNASPLVELVESGDFLFEKAETTKRVTQFMQTLRRNHPAIDTFTLSSTHLPWLLTYFREACPDCLFIDPADAIVRQLNPTPQGKGTLQCLVTEHADARYGLANFQAMTQALGLQLPIRCVQIR